MELQRQFLKVCSLKFAELFCLKNRPLNRGKSGFVSDARGLRFLAVVDLASKVGLPYSVVNVDATNLVEFWIRIGWIRRKRFHRFRKRIVRTKRFVAARFSGRQEFRFSGLKKKPEIFVQVFNFASIAQARWRRH